MNKYYLKHLNLIALLISIALLELLILSLPVSLGDALIMCAGCR